MAAWKAPKTGGGLMATAAAIRRPSIFRRFRKDKAAILAGWAGLVARIPIETGDEEFLAVVKRMAEA